MARTKPHRTLTITKEWLEDHGACEDAREELVPFLPVVVSTNPEDNLELCERLVDETNADQSYANDIVFLGGWLLARGDDARRDDAMSYYDRAVGILDAAPEKDPTQRMWLAAQYMAWGVDHILSAQGK